VLPPIFFEAAGFVGVALYLGSYAALQAGFLRGSGFAYAAMNFLAASFVLISLLAEWNLWSAIIQTSWIVISIVGLTRLWILKRALRFNEEEERFVAAKFPALDRVDARRFLNAGQWCDGHPGDYMTLQGKPVTDLYYLASGSVRVDVADQTIARVGVDHFIGEMACLEQGPASATVRVAEPARYFTISSEALDKLVRRWPDIRPHLHFAFFGNTQAKLIETNRAYSEALRLRGVNLAGE
jgi:hypothetical protein